MDSVTATKAAFHIGLPVGGTPGAPAEANPPQQPLAGWTAAVGGATNALEVARTANRAQVLSSRNALGNVLSGALSAFHARLATLEGAEDMTALLNAVSSAYVAMATTQPGAPDSALPIEEILAAFSMACAAAERCWLPSNITYGYRNAFQVLADDLAQGFPDLATRVRAYHSKAVDSSGTIGGERHQFRFFAGRLTKELERLTNLLEPQQTPLLLTHQPEQH